MGSFAPFISPTFQWQGLRVEGLGAGTAALPLPVPWPPSHHEHSCSSFIEELQRWQFSGLRPMASRGLLTQASGQELQGWGGGLCPGGGTSTPAQGHILPCPLPSTTPPLPHVWSKGMKGCWNRSGGSFHKQAHYSQQPSSPCKQFYSVLRIMQQSVNIASLMSPL